MRRFTLCLLSLISLIVYNSLPAEEFTPTTVILIRHAEKSSTPTDNPSLNGQGRARSKELIHVLGEVGIQAIYTTQYARTRETAEPLSKHLSLPILQIDANRSRQLVDEVLAKHRGGTVLIIGHSNTLPEIIQAFGGGSIREIGNNEYDNLFVLDVYRPGKAKLLRLKYF